MVDSPLELDNPAMIGPTVMATMGANSPVASATVSTLSEAIVFVPPDQFTVIANAELLEISTDQPTPVGGAIGQGRLYRWFAVIGMTSPGAFTSFSAYQDRCLNDPLCEPTVVAYRRILALSFPVSVCQ